MLLFPFLLLYILTAVSNSPEIARIVLIDYDSSETFLNVFLDIYGMRWSHPTHFDQIIAVLSDFETDPSKLFDNETCLEIVIDQINLGFQTTNGGFLYNRSVRLLTRIFRMNPSSRVIRLFIVRLTSLPEILLMIRSYYERRLLLKESSRYPISSKYFDKITRSQ